MSTKRSSTWHARYDSVRWLIISIFCRATDSSHIVIVLQNDSHAKTFCQLATFDNKISTVARRFSHLTMKTSDICAPSVALLRKLWIFTKSEDPHVPRGLNRSRAIQRDFQFQHIDSVLINTTLPAHCRTSSNFQKSFRNDETLASGLCCNIKRIAWWSAQSVLTSSSSTPGLLLKIFVTTVSCARCRRRQYVFSYSCLCENINSVVLALCFSNQPIDFLSFVQRIFRFFLFMKYVVVRNC